MIDVYRRLFERLNIFEHALGDMEASSGRSDTKPYYELLSHNLTPAEEEERISQNYRRLFTIFDKHHCKSRESGVSLVPWTMSQIG